MSTMEALAVGWRAARDAKRARVRVRRRSSVAAAILEHGLTVVGLSCFVAAAALVAIPVGLAVAGVAFLILEWKVSP